MRFIVTAGPTREYLDDVRFLTNASSGRMGYAIARAAAKRGHSVHLSPARSRCRSRPACASTASTSTQEMYEAAKKLFPRADCLIGAAAPADFTPVRRIKGKAKKAESSLALRLKPTVDILATLGRAKSQQIIIAFALEVQSPLKNARLKLRRKNADAIVLNSPAAIGALPLRRDDPPPQRRATGSEAGHQAAPRPHPRRPRRIPAREPNGRKRLPRRSARPSWGRNIFGSVPFASCASSRLNSSGNDHPLRSRPRARRASSSAIHACASASTSAGARSVGPPMARRRSDAAT